MSKHLQRDMDALTRELLAMSSLVEEMIQWSCTSLVQGRAELVAAVTSQESEVNAQEVRIEEECLRILALHQPVAVDLRRVASILKINSDLERTADLSVGIAECAAVVLRFPAYPIPAQINQMVRLSIQMVHDSLNAFVALDAVSARCICARDDEVDGLHRELVAGVQRLMIEQPGWIEPSMQFYSALGNLERIADLATNVAEDAIFLVEGQITRHQFHANSSPT